MTRTHLILANHPSPLVNAPVRGVAVTRTALRTIVNENPGKTFQVIAEDIFIGSGKRYQCPQISTDERLQRDLREETKGYRKQLAKVKDGINSTDEKLEANPIWEVAIRANREQPGRVTFGFSDFDETSQVKTLLAQYWREQGYHLAYRDGDTAGSIDLLLEGMRLTLEAVDQRDELLVNQRKRSDSEEVVIIYGYHHQNLCRKNWGGILEIYSQSEPGLSYWDELLVRMTMGQNIGEGLKRAYMHAELGYNLMLQKQLLSIPAGMALDDLKGMLRAVMREQLGF